MTSRSAGLHGPSTNSAHPTSPSSVTTLRNENGRQPPSARNVCRSTIRMLVSPLRTHWPIDRRTRMIRLMKLAATLVISLLTLLWNAAQAREERCTAPPYGASMEAYNGFIAEGSHSGPADGPAGILARICRMKYDAADRTELYRAGFTPEDIEHSSTVMLTSEYLGVLKYVAFQNTVHGQPAPKPDAPLPPPSEYQTVSVRDFAAEGPKLAARMPRSACPAGTSSRTTVVCSTRTDRPLSWPDSTRKVPLNRMYRYWSTLRPDNYASA